jgi:MFS family permease
MSAVRRQDTVTRHNLRCSSRDGGWYSVMWSVGESNIAVFGVALGLAPAVVGLLETVPRLCGSILQTITPRAVMALGSHKRWMVITATTQALIFVPMLIGALLGGMPTWTLFLLAAVYWAAAWSCGNAWTTYISTVVPRQVRSVYFATRNRWLNVIIVVATLVSGWSLAGGRASGRELETFAVLFGIACLSRLASAWYLKRQVELVPIPPGTRQVGVRELIGRYRHAPGGKLLLYRLSVEFALQVAAPFLVPFMLQERGLKQNYAAFGALVAAQILAKAAVMPLWGRVAHRHGPRALLRIGGLAIIPVPLLWLADDSFAYMLSVQLLTGVALGAYELASFLLVFDAVHERERTSVMSKYNVAQFTVTLVGSLIGAWLLRNGDPAAASIAEGSSVTVSHAAGYLLVFCASTFCRVLTLILLSKVPQHIKPGEIPESAATELPPLASTFEQPVIPTHSVGKTAPTIASTDRAGS